MTDYNPPQTPLVILHEEEHVLAVDKPSGLLSVPGRGDHLADCLLARVQAAFPTALLVHRLDRDTSGVILFALSPHGQRHLGLQFEKRQTKKTYIARVEGVVQDNTGTVDLPLCVDWPNRPRQHVDFENGKPAQTDWRVLRRSETETRLRLMPLTGRSHQLRVHCQALGHPILGDSLYHPNPEQHPRLMLHAQELRFRSPEDGRGIRVVAKPPF